MRDVYYQNQRTVRFHSSCYTRRTCTGGAKETTNGVRFGFVCK